MMAAAYVMNEDEVIRAIQTPFVMVASDGMFRKDQGHPRGAGAFPKVLGKYVRKMNKLSLADAVQKMTLMPAERLELSTKGKIKEGFDEPTLPPGGIEYVIVNVYYLNYLLEEKGKLALVSNISHIGLERYKGIEM